MLVYQQGTEEEHRREDGKQDEIESKGFLVLTAHNSEEQHNAADDGQHNDDGHDGKPVPLQKNEVNGFMAISFSCYTF